MANEFYVPEYGYEERKTVAGKRVGFNKGSQVLGACANSYVRKPKYRDNRQKANLQICVAQNLEA